MLTEVKNYRGFVLSKFIFFSASEGLCPSDPLTRSSVPGPRSGLRPPTPHYSEEITATGWQQATYRNSAEHLAVDEEIHSFTAALDFDVLHWVDWTVATHDTSLTN